MRKLKLPFILLTVLSALYILFPFINGLGCNFSFQESGEHVKQIGKCKSGVLTTYYQASDYDKSSYNRYIYGVFGNTFYLVRINKERVRGQKIFHDHADLGKDHEHVFSLYDGDRLYLSKYICISNRKCFVITDDSIENIYEMDFEGRLGFLATNSWSVEP